LSKERVLPVTGRLFPLVPRSDAIGTEDPRAERPEVLARFEPAPTDFARSPETTPLGRLGTDPVGREEFEGRAGLFEVTGRDERVALDGARDEREEPLPEALDGFCGLDGVARGVGLDAGLALEGDDRGAGCDFEAGAGLGLADDEERLLPGAEAGRLLGAAAGRLLDEDDDERFDDEGAEALDRFVVVRLFPVRSICTGR
jgi:hypothetical protein